MVVIDKQQLMVVERLVMEQVAVTGKERLAVVEAVADREHLVAAVWDKGPAMVVVDKQLVGMVFNE